MTKPSYKLIPMELIRPEIRELAVAWAETSEMTWIGDKHKLASDIQNYADWYADELYKNKNNEQA